MKKLNKILALLLIMAMILPGFTFRTDANNLDNKEAKLVERALEKFGSDVKAESVNVKELYGEFFKDDDEVRIIVELKTEPAIVQATSMNMRYSSMSQESLQKIEQQIEKEQQQVKNSIAANKVSMSYLNSFNTAFNGFSGMVKFGDIAIIESLPQVNKVYISNEYEKPEITPDMNTSIDLIGGYPAWELGYKGEGTVIAIIDTGIDFRHRDMVLSPETTPKLTRESLEGKNLLGKFYTDKVPYGYNYYDLNDEIRHIGPDVSMHGMHVAGTAAANGDVENGGIKGVAPEAQLLAMKVFSNDPIYGTTFSDIYLVAIDESVKLGADVLNMSLGSTASFYFPESPEDVAITNATNNGIVCSVSAGNSGSMTYGWANTNSGFPWKENPDIGLVGSPGLNKDTVQVASLENSHRTVDTLTYIVNGDEVQIPMAVAGGFDPTTVFTGLVEYVDGGSGHPSELENVAGKIALIVRGGLTPNFVDKIQNAQDAGAIGVIVRNHEAGGEELINMATPDIMTVPAVFIGYTGGLALMDLENKQVEFTGETTSVPNLDGGLMSDFSSWGLTPSLDMKPEITAPGGMIYSTLNDNKYGSMSGTSMAAPHVAGGSALVLEYIKEHPVYGQLSLSEQTRLAKVLLMNTANIIFDEYETEYSPRRQGAGLMNLYGAVSTPVRLVNEETNEAKVELKDFEDTTITMNFKAINDSNEDVTYMVDVVALTDYIHPVGLNLLTSDYINADMDYPETIVVPANGEVSFEVTIDISTDPAIYRNMFVEGFVSLIDVADENPALSVPYVGFYGDWGEPLILDGMRFIDEPGASYFNLSGMLCFNFLGQGYYYGTPHIYMNPGTFAGFINGTDNVMPYLSFMRNAEYVKYNILDDEGNNLRTIYLQQYKRKNYINGGSGAPVGMVTPALWDGTINGEVLPDGDYQYEILAKLHYESAQPQSKRIPITIDTTGPVISNVAFNQQTKTLTWDAVDAGIGLDGFMFDINGVETDIEIIAEEGRTSYELDMSPYITEDLTEYEVSIIAVDQLINMSIVDFSFVIEEIEEVSPYIYLYNPALFDAYDTNEVDFLGYVANMDDLEKVLINNVEADVEFMENVVLTHPSDPTVVLYSGPAFKFTKTLFFEDGYQEINVEAVSINGGSGNIVRRFFVDTTAPELNIEVLSVNQEAKTADLQIQMTDNMGYIELLQGDSEIFKHDSELVRPEPANQTIIHTVNLKDGDNYFVFTLNDMVGNSTVKSIVVNLGDTPQEPGISNIKPSRDVEIAVGESVTISFNAPTGGAAYFRILLPMNNDLNNNYGTPMIEEIPGFYTATWTAPAGFVATNMIVELVYIAEDGSETYAVAEGKITVIDNIDNMPINVVIIGNEAFSMDFLNKNAQAQEKFLNWMNLGNDVYIRLNRSLVVDQDGREVDIKLLPNRIIYIDEDGVKIFEN